MFEPSDTKIEALDQCAEGLHAISGALYRLGLDNAATPMGAIECLSKEILDGSMRIADGLLSIAAAIREAKK